MGFWDFLQLPQAPQEEPNAWRNMQPMPEQAALDPSTRITPQQVALAMPKTPYLAPQMAVAPDEDRFEGISKKHADLAALIGQMGQEQDVAINPQRAGLKAQQERVAQQEEMNKNRSLLSQLDLSPMLAMADEWARAPGASQGLYKRPMNAMENAAALASQKDKLQQMTGELSKQEIANKKDQMMALLGVGKLDNERNQTNALRSQMIGIREDEQASRATDRFTKNPQLIQFTGQGLQIDKGLKAFAKYGDDKVPIFRAKEIMQDFAGALAQGKATTDFKMQSMSIPTAEGKLAEWKQMLTGMPEDAPAPKGVVQFMRKLGQDLNQTYNEQVESTARRIATGMSYDHSAQSRKSVKSQVDMLSKGKWRAVLSGDEATPNIPLGAAPQAAPQMTDAQRQARIKELEAKAKQ